MSESKDNSCNNAGEDCFQVNSPKLASSETPVTEQKKPTDITANLANGDNQAETDKGNNTLNTPEANNDDENQVVKLKQELEKRTSERDEFLKKLKEAEIKLSNINSSQPSILNKALDSEDKNMNLELEILKTKLEQTQLVLDDRERRLANQENQISALTKQVNSLKEVVSITKDMLNIRNMEVRHLQEDVDKMETKITEERDRHNEMLNKMDTAVRLNADLKKEYQTQLQLFQDLRGKYEEKVTLLSEENKALETAVQAQPAQ